MNLAITCGDVNGIGLEVFFKALLFHEFVNERRFNPFLFIHSKTLFEYLNKMNIPFSFGNEILTVNNYQINIIECEAYSEVNFGQETISSGQLSSQSIYKALESYDKLNVDALVTLPISKHSLKLAFYKQTSHTDILKEYFKNSNPMMLFYYNEMITALATIHIPIAEVSIHLSVQYIYDKINILNSSLKHDFLFDKPRIAVLALNPHAGENGEIGTEDDVLIAPAINKAKEKGISVFGPFPADGFYGFGEFRNYDAILAMYHDQGLIPMKLISEGKAVNYTANLPVVRTSPDHGTAFNLAGKNVADPGSIIEAILLAQRIASARKAGKV